MEMTKVAQGKGMESSLSLTQFVEDERLDSITDSMDMNLSQL